MIPSPARRALPALVATLLLALLVACGGDPAAAPAPATPTAPGDAPTRTWLVRNDAPAGGDGSLAAPFATLAAAERAARPGDTLVVLAGDGTSRGYDRGVTLQRGQRLLGGAAPQLTELGIPAGPAPRLTNPRGTAVTVAPDTVVAGIEIRAPGGHGVTGRVAGRVVVEGVAVIGAAGDGVQLDVVGDAPSRLRLAGNRLLDNAGTALLLTYPSGSGGSFEIVDHPEIRSLRGSGIRVFAAGDAAQRIEGRVAGNRIGSAAPDTAGNGVAVVIEGDARARVAITGNEVRGFGAYGIDVAARGGRASLDATVAGNRVSEPRRYALAALRAVAGNGSSADPPRLCLALDALEADGAVVALRSPAARFEIGAAPAGALEPSAAEAALRVGGAPVRLAADPADPAVTDSTAPDPALTDGGWFGAACAAPSF